MMEYITTGKALGVAGGTIASLAMMPPKTIWDLITRSFVSIWSGMTFAAQTQEYLSWVKTDPDLMASGAITAYLSWWALGAIMRWAKAWMPK